MWVCVFLFTVENRLEGAESAYVAVHEQRSFSPGWRWEGLCVGEYVCVCVCVCVCVSVGVVYSVWLCIAWSAANCLCKRKNFPVCALLSLTSVHTHTQPVLCVSMNSD